MTSSINTGENIVGKNAVGFIAVARMSAIGIAATVTLNAIGLVTASIPNAIGVIAIGGKSSRSIFPMS